MTEKSKALARIEKRLEKAATAKEVVEALYDVFDHTGLNRWVTKVKAHPSGTSMLCEGKTELGPILFAIMLESSDSARGKPMLSIDWFDDRGVNLIDSLSVTAIPDFMDQDKNRSSSFMLNEAAEKKAEAFEQKMMRFRREMAEVFQDIHDFATAWSSTCRSLRNVVLDNGGKA